MKIGIHISALPDVGHQRPTITRFAEMVRMADQLGFERITTGDAQGNSLECITALTYMVTLTKRAKIGGHVANPITRHPGVVAAALASLDVISNGRTFLVLGTGDSAVRNLGLAPATRARTTRYLETVRELLTTSVSTHEDRPVRLSWPSATMSVPLYIAAEGPKMLADACAVADGIYVGTGLCPEIVIEALEVSRRASEARRGVAPLDLWWGTRSAVARVHDEALHMAKESLSSAGNHGLRGDYEAKRVPLHLRGALARYHALYDYREKAKKDSSGGNVRIMDELGLTPFFLSRYGIVGTPDEVVARLRELQSFGVAQVLLHARRPVDVRLIGTEVLPRLA